MGSGRAIHLRLPTIDRLRAAAPSRDAPPIGTCARILKASQAARRAGFCARAAGLGPGCARRVGHCERVPTSSRRPRPPRPRCQPHLGRHPGGLIQTQKCAKLQGVPAQRGEVRTASTLGQLTSGVVSFGQHSSRSSLLAFRAWHPSLAKNRAAQARAMSSSSCTGSAALFKVQGGTGKHVDGAVEDPLSARPFQSLCHLSDPASACSPGTGLTDGTLRILPGFHAAASRYFSLSGDPPPEGGFTPLGDREELANDELWVPARRLPAKWKALHAKERLPPPCGAAQTRSVSCRPPLTY